MDFIECLERTIGKETEKIYLPMQPGDVYQTYADTTRLEKDINYIPRISLEYGVSIFIEWFNYHLKYIAKWG